MVSKRQAISDAKWRYDNDINEIKTYLCRLEICVNQIDILIDKIILLSN